MYPPPTTIIDALDSYGAFAKAELRSDQKGWLHANTLHKSHQAWYAKALKHGFMYSGPCHLRPPIHPAKYGLKLQVILK